MGKELPGLVALGRRKAQEDFPPLAEVPFFIQAQGVPYPQVLADSLLAFGRQALEALVIGQDAFLVLGREFFEPAHELLPVPVLPASLMHPGAALAAHSHPAPAPAAPSPALREGLPGEERRDQ